MTYCPWQFMVSLIIIDRTIMTLTTSGCPHWRLPHIVVDRHWALPQHLCQNQANDLGIFIFFFIKMLFWAKNFIHEFFSAPPMERLGLRGPRDFLLCCLQHSHLLWIDHRQSSNPLVRWRQQRRVRISIKWYLDMRFAFARREPVKNFF